MAVFRSVHLSFWTDNKVMDEFTPEDKYFYMYLLTNPQTNICGCYELSWLATKNQTGYNEETILRLLDRFEKVHGVIRFCKETKEVLVLHWHKYNWSKSEATLKGVENVAEHIKCEEFKEYVFSITNNLRNNTPTKGHIGGMVASVSDTVTDINNNSNNNNSNEVDFETIWQQTFNAYPKKTNHASAKAEWMNRLSEVVEPNRKDVATMIWRAMKAYLKDYEQNNPDDSGYRFVPAFNKWLTEELDYWLAEIQRRKESEE
jgi:hypothetical protein